MSQSDKKHSVDGEGSDVLPIMLEGSAIYQVHDNGGRPFTVLVDEQNPNGICVLVYETRGNRSASNQENAIK